MPSALGWSNPETASSRRESMSSPVRSNSECSVPRRADVERAEAASLKSCSVNARVNVLTLAFCLAAIAASAVESRPPLRNTPTGTSAIKWQRTESSRAARTCSTGAAPECIELEASTKVQYGLGTNDNGWSAETYPQYPGGTEKIPSINDIGSQAQPKSR